MSANTTIVNNIIKAYHFINQSKYKNIACFISGGSDSDIMLDIIYKCDARNIVKYIWFDTGLEYQATKNHIKYLESRYSIEIIRYKAIKSIPKSCVDCGQPFLSKLVSEFISRLQKHNFKFEDENFDVLYKRYPKCKSALQWWCNEKGLNSKFNISYNKFLKEFMIMNPPTFKISNKCCYYSKKQVSNQVIKDLNIQLSCVGIRKSEGGVRAIAYKNCFSENDNIAHYRPIFFYTNNDKEEYKKHFNIKYSNCYSEYGLTRTGCAGCPYGRNLKKELNIIHDYEPKLEKAIYTIFKDSYEYTNKYKEFVKQKTIELSNKCIHATNTH